MKDKLDNLLGFDEGELTRFALGLDEKPFRGKQLYQWIYGKLVTDFGRMTNLGIKFRTQLFSIADIRLPEITSIKKTADGSAAKYRLKLEDGLLIESVLLRESKRTTLCVSTQVGCALKCRFCATGYMGFKRNLTAGEIVGQYMAIVRESGAVITNIVYMGMGEPLLNYDNVKKSIRLFTDGDGLARSSRKITISTAGIIPGLNKMTEDRLPCKLAISLNAPTDSLRRYLMPIAKKYPLKDLLSAAHDYEQSTRHRVTFEYVLIKGINDTDHHAQKLKRTLGGFTAKLNLIVYNPTDYVMSGSGRSYEKPDVSRAEKFMSIVERPGLTVMIRKSLGEGIDAACGQLCLRNNK